MILLPGNGWTGAATFVSSGSLAALLPITNLDGSKTNLIFDVHKYLDTDGSGTHTDCVTNNINEAFAPLATALRNEGRQAILSETGGGNTQSCVKYMCEQIAFLNANSDVYLGYVAVSKLFSVARSIILTRSQWSAGAFQKSWNYELDLVPVKNGNSWTDTLLMNSCFKR
jgi:endoglucanase